MGAEVSRLQLYERRHTKAADSAESGGPVQGAGSGTDGPDERGEHQADGRGPNPVLAGLDRLLREVRNAFGVGGLGRVAPAQAPVCDLEAVETGNDEVCRTSQTGRETRLGRENGGERTRTVAVGGLAGTPYRAAQCLLRLAWDSKINRLVIAQPAEPPNAGPHVRWCGRGGVARLPPIPIQLSIAYWPRPPPPLARPAPAAPADPPARSPPETGADAAAAGPAPPE